MEQPRFIAGDLSTDFVAEEWDTRKKASPEAPRRPEEPVGSHDGTGTSVPTAMQVAAIVGSLLADEQMEIEKLRRRPVAETNGSGSRWRDVGRKEALRGL